jgi:hypothetical protein
MKERLPSIIAVASIDWSCCRGGAGGSPSSFTCRALAIHPDHHVILSVDGDKPMGLRTSRLRRVRSVRWWRAMYGVWRLPGMMDVCIEVTPVHS